jgi:hypothetical protein
MNFALTQVLDLIQCETPFILNVIKALCKTCEYLITGRDPEVKKLRSALESHKTILNENEFFDFIEYK